MSKRIILTTYGSLGDLHPFIALAIELKKRGHQVAIATSEQYHSQVIAESIDFFYIRPNFALSKEMMEQALSSFEGGRYIHCEIVLPQLKNTYNDLMKAVEGADLLITHPLSVAGALVAEKTGISWVSTILSPILIVSAYESIFLSDSSNIFDRQIFNPLVNNIFTWLGKTLVYSWNAPVREFRAELGLAAAEDPLFEGKYSPELVLALFSSIFAQPQIDWHKQIEICGFTFYDSPSETAISGKLIEFLELGSPPIVFTLGSASVNIAGNFYSESVLAARKLGYRAILLTGDRQNVPQELLGSKDVIAFNYIPYSLIFSRSIAIVHQGGIGTTAQALRAGKPMLIVPYSHDQPNNAYRAERLGVARVVEREHYTAEHVAIELQKLLTNPDYARRASEISCKIQAENGVKKACDLIEARLGLSI